MAHRLVPVLALLAVSAAPLSAQAPGYEQVDTRQIMAAYHAEVLDGVNKVMARWGEFWEADDVDRVADLYWENASLIPPAGAPRRGRDAIRAYLAESFPAHGRMEAFMLDFDASGGMALVSGNYALDVDGVQQRGALTTIYVQRGRTWKIRAQVFTPADGS